MAESHKLRNLPDGSLTREEVNAMLDVIEAWDADFPWEFPSDEYSAEGEFQCYACGERTKIEVDRSQPEWWEKRPEAEKGYSDECPWIKTREWERGIE